MVPPAPFEPPPPLASLLARLDPEQQATLAAAFHWPRLFPPPAPTDPNAPPAPAPATGPDLTPLLNGFRQLAALMMQFLPKTSPQLALFMQILQALGLFASGAATQAAAAKAGATDV